MNENKAEKSTKTPDCDSICTSVTPATDAVMTGPYGGPPLYGVVDKMPLRPVITASCPADRGTQQPYFFSLSLSEIRPGCTEAKPKHSAVILHAWRGEDVRFWLQSHDCFSAAEQTKTK